MPDDSKVGDPVDEAPLSASRLGLPQGPQRWVRHIPTVIAVAALSLSVSTAFIDIRHTRAQDQRSAGLELTDSVQRIVALRRQYAESSSAAGANKALLQSTFSQEKTALAARAVEILEKYPRVGSAPEYEVVVEARVTDIDDVVQLVNVDQYIRLLETSVDQTENVEEEASLLARGGGILFRLDQFDRARQMYMRSVAAVADKPALHYAASYYEALWGSWEASRQQCEEARKHLEAARRHWMFARGSGSSDAISDLETRISNCSPGSEKPSSSPDQPAVATVKD